MGPDILARANCVRMAKPVCYSKSGTISFRFARQIGSLVLIIGFVNSGVTGHNIRDSCGSGLCHGTDQLIRRILIQVAAIKKIFLSPFGFWEKHCFRDSSRPKFQNIEY
ncbi:hypothetical protein BABINDRAFT_161658, partial [Babjeviella inositovora NRRL Y-12698]